MNGTSSVNSLQRRSCRLGRGKWEFLLPSEDEWEKAARGADSRFFAWGDEFDPTFCRMESSRAGEQEELDSEPFGLFPVDESPFGLRDMSGGMAEWTRTLAGPQGEWRILKGGSWGATPPLCRVAYRLESVPESVDDFLGLRLAARRIR